MIKAIKYKIHYLAQKDGERSKNIFKNIALSFVVKGLSVLVNFLIVPITIGYIDQARYGIWITLTSIITWVAFFDLGMANGLKNKLATALAHEDYDNAKKYVSTAYLLLALIALFFFILFYVADPFINWNSFLNVPVNVHENIHWIMLVVMGTFCLQFTLQLLNAVLASRQETAKADFLTLLGQFAILIILLVLKKTVVGSLSILVFALNMAPVVVLIIASVLLYRGKLKAIAPSYKSIDFSYAKSIFNVGGSFFLIQLGSLVLHQTDNIIITRVLGPEAVTKFYVTFKLFSVITLGFSIIIIPFWSAFTDAYTKKDYVWIAKSMNRLRKVWMLTSFVAVPILFLLSKFAFQILFPEISISYTLAATMAVYVVCAACLSFNCIFLYGTGKLKVLLLLYLIVTVSNIPLGIVMGKHWGIEGVIIANIVAYVFMSIILWVQVDKILQQKAAGIWNA